MNIVFFGTSGVGEPILRMLNQHHSIKLIVTSPDAPVGRKQILTPSPIARIAYELGIATEKPSKVKSNTEFIAKLTALQADIFVVVSYGKILPLDVINIPPLKTINVHFSLLPKYRGAAPIQYMLASGDTTAGTTIFILDEKMDTGPILSQQSLPIEKDDTFTTLSSKLAMLSADLLIDTIPQYEQGLIIPQVQNESEATYVRIIKKEDGKINWEKTGQEIYNKFRGFNEWPGIWTTWDNKLLKILECAPGPETDKPPGTVIDSAVSCGNGTSLLLQTIQMEGKKPIDIKTFLNGYTQFNGAMLE